MRWLKAAGIRREAYAEYTLGTLYAAGDGVPKSRSNALEWWLWAAADSRHGVDESKLADRAARAIVRVEVEGQMSPAEIVDAYRRALARPILKAAGGHPIGPDATN